ncbi:MAG: MotA/TolQ/ExbB proton channel family protein [Burkholderiaceae bacterium]|nr:MotA/TolQ/ExbB proton channel family protein [Burkholderiaceae bacterium]
MTVTQETAELAPAVTPLPTAATTVAPASPLGFGHFIAQSDAVGQTLLVVLLVMSVLSWAVIALKGLAHGVQRRRSQRFLDRFWNAASLKQVEADLAARPAHEGRDPFSQLTQQALQAQAHHARHGTARLSDAGTAGEFVTRTLKKALDEETMRLESGLTLLATVGATAPFVGLFGTVWGVYHALVAIGASAADGPGSLAQVAGPVGEALIMTGLGLAVAIPAVMAYNVYTRRNRMIGSRLDAFAYELHTFVAMGQPLGSGTPTAEGTAAAVVHADKSVAAKVPVQTNAVHAPVTSAPVRHADPITA